MMSMDERPSEQSHHIGCVQERRFVCPLTKRVMTDAVRIGSTGKSYERQALNQWIERNGRICPVTGMAFRSTDIETNFGLQWEILYSQRQTSPGSNLGGDDQATVASMSSSTSISGHTSSLPPPPPSAPVDSPPTRPKRRGSGNAAAVSASTGETMHQSSQPLDNSRRFTSCKELCPSDTLLRLPRRIPSFLTLMNLDSIEPTEILSQGNDDCEGNMERLIIALDAALQVTEEV